MKKEETVEIFAEESNFAVIRAPNRKYPGVLIQGDSLGGIISDLKEAIKLFESDREESLGCLTHAFEELEWRLEGYLEVCRMKGIA